MAKLYPDLETIKHLHQRPTQGELELLSFLDTNIKSDEFEIYFQPYFNGDNPDIILLKKNCGLLIFEVKDWSLNKYYIDEETNWHLAHNNRIIMSPFKQVRKYRDNMYDVHIDKLILANIDNKYRNYHKLINTAVYFSNENKNEIDRFLFEKFKDKRHKNYRDSFKYATWLGKDSLTIQHLDIIINKLSSTQGLFDNNLYEKFKRYLQPPFHELEEGKEISYTNEQNALIRSEQRPRRKIKGIAGCGKTLVLAKRAVNSYIRTKSKVLILTFNISLKNYIHDRISDVRENFSWAALEINNYHEFFKAKATKHNLNVDIDSYDNINFFADVEADIKKYKSIFIDEAQDFKEEWLKIVHNFFLEDDCEFVVFGDEKQNVYNRLLDDNREPKTIGIPGRWNKSLKSLQRFTNEIGSLAIDYQKIFMTKKYSVDELQTQLSLPEEQKIISYFDLSVFCRPDDIFNKYSELVHKYNIHPSDISFLSPVVAYLREIDYLIRTKMNERTTTTFETKEIFTKLEHEKGKIVKIRRNKKEHFWMKTGTTKLSTIHSFKGWESHTVFLLIPHNIETFSEIEQVYTGLTRARVNLFILNMGNYQFDNFFSKRLHQ